MADVAEAQFLGRIVQDEQVRLHLGHDRGNCFDQLARHHEQIIGKAQEAHVLNAQNVQPGDDLFFLTADRYFLIARRLLTVEIACVAAAQVVRRYPVRTDDNRDLVAALGVQAQRSACAINGVGGVANDRHDLQVFTQLVTLR